MTGFASCFKGPEAKSSMEMETFLQLTEENEQKPSAGPGAPTRKSCLKCFCSLELDISSKMFS